VPGHVEDTLLLSGPSSAVEIPTVLLVQPVTAAWPTPTTMLSRIEIGEAFLLADYWYFSTCMLCHGNEVFALSQTAENRTISERLCHTVLSERFSIQCRGARASSLAVLHWHHDFLTPDARLRFAMRPLRDEKADIMFHRMCKEVKEMSDLQTVDSENK
jgi:hypothetical protein